ncbi:MAG TPA: hemolysin III family protein [Acidimicrobiia bacterium]|nr:hemolysin III family protein [Acidimicrobiia bacterium]
MDAPRWTLGRMQNPVRGFLHGAAAIAAVVGTIYLAVISPTTNVRIGSIVFGLAMVALYTTSSLYHGVPWSDAWKKRMQRLDHTMIIVLIAGTYTPVAIVALNGWLQWAVLGIAWGAVAIGALQHTFFPTDGQVFSMALGITMGWLGIVIGWKFIESLGWTAAMLGLIGGVIYTTGVVLIATNRPRLWPRVFSYHELFHVMVVTATSIHFVMVSRYVLPLAA